MKTRYKFPEYLWASLQRESAYKKWRLGGRRVQDGEHVIFFLKIKLKKIKNKKK